MTPEQMTPEQISQLERNLRQSCRDDGSMTAATDDVFDAMRRMNADLADARFSAIAYLGRAQRAETAHQELAVTQDLLARAKEDVAGLRRQCEIFRNSWLDCRDRLEVAQSELHAMKNQGGAK